MCRTDYHIALEFSTPLEIEHEHFDSYLNDVFICAVFY